MAFLNPYFLFALAAIAVPVILHLVQLRRAKRVQFSNVRFIQASQEVTASQRKLKDLLILICRILFICFLVFAFSQPFIPGTSKATNSDKNVALMIDNSYSMQNIHADQDLSLLAFATDKAKSVFDLFPSNTNFALLDNTSFSGNKYPSASEARLALNNLNFNPANPQFRQISSGHIFLFSDFQKNKFKASGLSQLDSTAQVHLLPLEASGTANIYIDTVFLEDVFLRPSTEVALHVKVVNTGKDDLTDLPLKLIVDDQQLASLTIDLAANKTTESIINFRVSDKRISNAFVTIEHYPVEFDNTYYFVLAASGSINVVEIADGDELELKNLYSKEGFFKYSLYQPQNINYAQASTADIILVNGLKDITPALAAILGNFVNKGGTLTIIPPSSGNISGYENLFSSVKVGASFSGVKADAIAKSDLIAPSPDNPFFKGIFAAYDRKIQMPTAARSIRWSRATEDILKFRGGAPFLSRFERGSGQVYVMAAPLHETHSSLVNHALFLPIMYKLAISSYKQEQPLAYTLRGQTIKFPITQQNQKEGIYTLEKDSLSFIPEQQVRGGHLYFNIPPDLNEAGIYNLTLQGKPIGNVAFNYDNEESILDQYTPDELRAMIPATYKNIHVYDYGDAFSVKNEFEKRFFGVKLWKYCLILCLIFLMAEIALIRFL
ncbi:BatA domain-containing protein [Pontibacter sp. H259]|uniref:BatA domain-containing protein n=1 Tax=Pontibacter sp. H259 TaxID=3133421 RepID=UPI0030BCE362